VLVLTYRLTGLALQALRRWPRPALALFIVVVLIGAIASTFHVNLFVNPFASTPHVVCTNPDDYISDYGQPISPLGTCQGPFPDDATFAIGLSYTGDCRVTVPASEANPGGAYGYVDALYCKAHPATPAPAPTQRIGCVYLEDTEALKPCPAGVPNGSTVLSTTDGEVFYRTPAP